MDEPLPWPIDLGYIVCDPCFDGNCADCVGLTHTRPFCGHRCGFLIDLSLNPTLDRG